jgi:hypothetical protein
MIAPPPTPIATAAFPSIGSSEPAICTPAQMPPATPPRRIPRPVQFQKLRCLQVPGSPDVKPPLVAADSVVAGECAITPKGDGR